MVDIIVTRAEDSIVSSNTKLDSMMLGDLIQHYCNFPNDSYCKASEKKLKAQVVDKLNELHALFLDKKSKKESKDKDKSGVVQLELPLK